MNPLILAPTTLPHTPPVEYVKAAIAAGYDGVGVRLHRSPGLPFHPLVGDARLERELKAVLQDASMPVHDIFSCYLQPDTSIAEFTPTLAFGAELAAKYVMVMGNDPDLARMRDNFGLFCDEAARFGLTAAIEFVPTRPLATMQIAARMIQEAGRDNAVICIDPLHFTRTGGTPAAIDALGPRYFPYTQINDGVLFPGEPDPAQFGKMPQGKRRLLGEGDVPLYDLLDALPPGLPLSVEIPLELGESVRAAGTQPWSAPEWAKFALEHVREFMTTYYAAKATAS